MSKASEFTHEHLKKMKPGIEVFNNQMYWECHEELEHVWLEDRGDDVRNVYWAIIQVAAALVHYENANEIGAQGLLKKAKEKFLRVKNMGIDNQLVYDHLDWKELNTLVFELNDDAKIEEFSKLYNFRFKNYPY